MSHCVIYAKTTNEFRVAIGFVFKKNLAKQQNNENVIDNYQEIIE